MINMENQFLVRTALNCTELALMIFLAIKVICSLIYFKKKNNVILNRNFWFYIFFIITYTVYIGIQFIDIFAAHGYLNGDLIDRTLINYMRTITFTASFLYLQVYCNKVITTKSTNDLYLDAKKILKRKRIIEKSTVLFGIITAWIQTIMIGVFPFFIANPSQNVEVLSTFCVLSSCIAIWILYCNTDNCKQIVLLWAIFVTCNLFILPLSVITQKLLMFGNGYEFEKTLALALRSIFLLLRTSQVIILAMNAFRFSDVRLLYDRVL